MPQFLNESSGGGWDAVGAIGSSLANWGMNQMQIKQEREQKAQDLEREQRLWKEHTDTALRLGAPEERVMQVRDAQTGKAMEVRQRLKLGSAVAGTASEWENVGEPTEAPPPPKKFAAGFGFYDESGKSYPDQAVQDAELRQKAAGASRTNVSMPGMGPQENEFEKEIGKLGASRLNKYMEDASAAGNALQALDTLEQISAKQQTGKGQEALAQAGQFLGTEAGANLQAYKAAAQRLVQGMARNLPGTLSDKDMESLQAAIPQFGNDPRANAIVIDLVRKGSQKQIDNANAAQAWAEEKKSLRGFKPTYEPPRTNVGDALEPKPSAASGAPKPGTVESGYRFKGGNPADPNSWEKI